jgi:hypothetical protein
MDLSRFDFERWEIWTYPIVQALLYSLSFHLALFGVLEVGSEMGWWKSMALPAWITAALSAPPAPDKPADKAKANTVDAAVPVLYVDVSPDQVSPTPPKDAQYYSFANAVAAAPEIAPANQTPTLEPKFEKPPPRKALTPAKSNLKTEGKPPDEKNPAGAGKGEITVGTPPVDTNRLASARTRAVTRTQAKPKAAPRRFSIVSSIDVKATPFGEYDAAVVAAVQKYWLFLLEQDDYVRGNYGKVVIEFRLHLDGRITDLRITENEVTELLSIICQRAILAPAPYAAWPLTMRQTVKAGFREVRFTFYYD